MVKLAFNPQEITLSNDIRNQPRYTIGDAAGYLYMPATTVSAWFFGTTYTNKLNGKKTAFESVLVPADPSEKLLSFDNLVEAYVLRQFRTKDRIQLRQLSNAMKFARAHLGIDKPLLDRNLLKGGKSLYLEKAGAVVGLSDPMQLLLPGAQSFFERVKYTDDAVSSLFLLTRPVPTDSPLVVSISPEYSFGRSVINRTKVSTSIIAERYLNGDSICDLAEDYDCRTQEIEESIRAEWMFARGQKLKAA
jgi:uncharacterized protein (DUF433 family)